MRKIISLTSKDFLTGVTPYPYDGRFGLWRTATGFNPYSAVGTIQHSKSSVDLTGEIVIDKIQNFVPNVADLYGIGAGGNFYKVATFSTATPTVSNLRAGSLIATPTYGMEVFQTQKGTGKKLYYWNTSTGTGYIGEWDLGTVWNDTKFAINTEFASSFRPTLRINDEVFYGTKNIVSEIYDDYNGTTGTADPIHLENVFDIAKDQTIVSLETDGTYLIVCANVSNSNESKIYFWDYKNEAESWTTVYTIKDTINKLKNVSGVIYASGTNGLYVFNSGSEPKNIRPDIKNNSGIGADLYNAMEKYNDGLLVSTSGGIKTYGEIQPQIKGAFTPFSDTPVTMKVVENPSGTTIGNRMYYSSGTKSLKYQDILAVPTASLYQGLQLITAPIDLGDTFKIGRIDIILTEQLATGQAIDSISLYGDFSAGTNQNASFNAVTYADYAGKTNCVIRPNFDLQADVIRLNLTTVSLGTNSIKRIDIYGEEITQ